MEVSREQKKATLSTLTNEQLLFLVNDVFTRTGEIKDYLSVDLAESTEIILEILKDRLDKARPQV